MKCSKTRFAFRPRVENLESRLQPGSIITGQGYGWSLLADNLSILNQASSDSPSLVSQSTSESTRPTQTSTSADVHSDNLSIAVASVAAARSTSLPANDQVASNVSAGLPANDLPLPTPVEHVNALLLGAAATHAAQLPSPATPVGSVPQSAVGVASPAQPIVTSTPATPSGSVLHATPAQSFSLPTPTAHAVTGLQTRNDLHVSAIPVGNAGIKPDLLGGNQASVNFLSYLGSATGPDSINSIVVQNEGGANFIYVAGSATDPTTNATDIFAAKLTDGATSPVWAFNYPTGGTGPDSALGLTVNSNGVYVVGNITDATAATGADGFVLQLDPGTGLILQQVSLNTSGAGSSIAAVATDPTGNIDIAGSVGDANTGGIDILFGQLTSGLQATTYGPNQTGFVGFIFMNNAGDPLNTAVNTGSGLIVDGQGDFFFGGSLSLVSNPNNVDGFFGRVNSTGTNVDWNHGLGNVNSGPGGQVSALAFDPNGNVVFTGSLNDGSNPGNPLNQDLAIGRADPTTGMLLDNGGGFYFYWSVDNRTAPGYARIGDWAGNSLVVLADGSTIVGGAAYDPAAGSNQGDPTSIPTKGVDVTMTHFVPTDDNTTQNGDGDPENDFGGSGTDIGLAVAIDPTMTTQTSNVNIYVAGSTTSTDLPTTSGVLGPTYSGSNATGFIGQANIT